MNVQLNKYDEIFLVITVNKMKGPLDIQIEIIGVFICP